jgi:pimeloyl-ACP methyl ester carboxylesterase
MDLTFNKGFYRTLAAPFMKTAIRFSALNGFDEQLEAILSFDVVNRLNMIKVSTLVIVGTEDKVIKPASSEQIAKLVPKAKLVKVVGGPHGFGGEMSGEFNKEVLSFLKN